MSPEIERKGPSFCLPRNRLGFTLIELMIVVVIIGILAAVAIPQFNRYLLKSRSTEAPLNLGAIQLGEQAFFARWDHFGLAMRNPPGDPYGGKRQWIPTTNVGFDLLGVQPAGNVYYQYAVLQWQQPDFGSQDCDLPDATANVALTVASNSIVVSAGATAMVGGQNAILMYARGDLDDDGLFSCFAMGDSTSEVFPVPAISGDGLF